MAGGVEVVRIQGLKELQASLRALDKSLPAELRKVNLSVAQAVKAKAQAIAEGQGAMTAKAATTLKATAQQRNAALVLSATGAVPFSLGAEFGAGHNSTRQRSSGTYLGYNQFRSWSGNGPDAGYFMYPGIRAENSHIIEAYDRQLAQLIARVFPH